MGQRSLKGLGPGALSDIGHGRLLSFMFSERRSSLLEEDRNAPSLLFSLKESDKSDEIKFLQNRLDLISRSLKISSLFHFLSE